MAATQFKLRMRLREKSDLSDFERALVIPDTWSECFSNCWDYSHRQKSVFLKYQSTVI